MLNTACPSCSKSLSVPDKYAGKKVKCPGCGEGVRIPEPEIVHADILPEGDEFNDLIDDVLDAASPLPTGAAAAPPPVARRNEWPTVQYPRAVAMDNLAWMHMACAAVAAVAIVAFIAFAVHSGISLFLVIPYAMLGGVGLLPLVATASVLRCLADMSQEQRQQTEDFRHVNNP